MSVLNKIHLEILFVDIYDFGENQMYRIDPNIRLFFSWKCIWKKRGRLIFGV